MTEQARYNVYQVKDNGKGKNRWIKVGAAFPNQDSKGFNIVLDALPINFDGELTARIVEEKLDSGESTAPASAAA